MYTVYLSIIEAKKLHVFSIGRNDFCSELGIQIKVDFTLNFNLMKTVRSKNGKYLSAVCWILFFSIFYLIAFRLKSPSIIHLFSIINCAYVYTIHYEYKFDKFIGYSWFVSFPTPYHNLLCLAINIVGYR